MNTLSVNSIRAPPPNRRIVCAWLGMRTDREKFNENVQFFIQTKVIYLGEAHRTICRAFSNVKTSPLIWAILSEKRNMIFTQNWHVQTTNTVNLNCHGPRPAPNICHLPGSLPCSLFSALNWPRICKRLKVDSNEKRGGSGFSGRRPSSIISLGLWRSRVVCNLNAL